MQRFLYIALCLLLLQACSDSNDTFNAAPPPEPEITYSADIVWTEYGIPHVTADDWASLGYGYAYAFAQENYCVVMAEYVRAAGESARYLGDDGDLNFDFVMKLYNDAPALERMRAALPARALELATGYAAGLNRYLAETGVDNLAEGEEGCRGAEWVRTVDQDDVIRMLHKLILRASADPLVDLIVAAQGPESVAANNKSQRVLPAMLQQQLAGLDPVLAAQRLGLPESGEIGSNAYGIGDEASGIASGVLFGNPHFPWQGPNRFFMSHLTIPGEYDVMGGSLVGIPAVVLGFNKDLAWSHTVSTGDRFTLHDLTLNPDNVLEYLVDGEARAFELVTVSAEAIGSGGAVETVEHTFYLSEYGPVVDLGSISPLLGGWPNAAGTVLAMQDVNKENLRGIDHWLNMGQAGDLDEFKQALQVVGNPWTNTIAADRFGNGFYGDISAVPHVSLQKFNTCVRGLIGPLLYSAAGLITLDGADSSCNWGSDEGAPAGVFGYDSLPKLETREYGANANDSYWLSNPRQLLEGYSPIIGSERIEQSVRTRLAFVQAEQRLAGTDGIDEPGFNNASTRTILHSARNLAAELVNDDVVSICSAVTDWSAYSSSPADVAEACDILSNWDTRHTIDSVGGHIFFEFWREVYQLSNLWAVPFDPADPVNTPNTLNSADPALVEAVRQGLADGVQRLLDNGIAMNLPWGEVQFDEKNGERIPIPGGSGGMLFSVITSNLIEGEGYSNITHGNSYIQAVSWDASDCPDANAILTYSQSTDPASAHYADATKLYSQGGWIDMPFCESDRDAQEIRRETVTE
jgi:acyl-homoserine-lactone acylase